jgi:hypothetical protein
VSFFVDTLEVELAGRRSIDGARARAAVDAAIHSIEDNSRLPRRRSSPNPSAGRKFESFGAAYDLADRRIRLLNK